MTTSAQLQQLANSIRSGEYPQQDVDLLQFFLETEDGEYIPDRDTRIQVRDEDRDIDRVNRGVNKMKQTGDYSGLDPLCIVQYPDMDKLLNGNHTAEMEVKLGMETGKGCIVDFDRDLGGKQSNVIRLGNLLNKQEVERVDVHDNDIKNELFLRMDERASEGLDPKLTEDELQDFVETYPHISRATIGQWVSNRNDVGARSGPRRTYTEGELFHMSRAFENMNAYKGYAICSPRTLRAWKDTGVGAIFDAMMDKGNGCCKALVILYCSTQAQADKWEKNEIQKTIRAHYDKLEEYYGVTIAIEMLSYD